MSRVGFGGNKEPNGRLARTDARSIDSPRSNLVAVVDFHLDTWLVLRLLVES